MTGFDFHELTFNRTIVELKRRRRQAKSTCIWSQIAPYWNWNYLHDKWLAGVECHLIAPYWNWNIGIIPAPVPRTPSNRTILELKLVDFFAVCHFLHASNRTILELKLRGKRYFNLCNVHLIAPYWNWNRRCSELSTTWSTTSNRTILELKHGCPEWDVKGWIPSNRTILELKHISNIDTSGIKPHLIAPYWNWNAANQTMEEIRDNHLIAPYWNWKTSTNSPFSVEYCHQIVPSWNWNWSSSSCRPIFSAPSNRTILELKRQLHYLIGFHSCTSNRTALELKPLTVDCVVMIFPHLIAPYWNWNMIYYLKGTSKNFHLIAPYWNWNTYSTSASGKSSSHLIAPNWNWNMLYQQYQAMMDKHLIAPYWKCQLTWYHRKLQVVCVLFVRIKKELQPLLQLFEFQWRISESNRWPFDCQSNALANWANPP